MSPVEPSPDVIGTIGWPSPPFPGALCFEPSAAAALESAGATNPPVMAPRAPRNVRRLQPNFEPMFSFLSETFLFYFLKCLTFPQREQADQPPARCQQFQSMSRPES